MYNADTDSTETGIFCAWGSAVGTVINSNNTLATDETCVTYIIIFNKIKKGSIALLRLIQ